MSIRASANFGIIWFSVSPLVTEISLILDRALKVELLSWIQLRNQLWKAVQLQLYLCIRQMSEWHCFLNPSKWGFSSHRSSTKVPLNKKLVQFSSKFVLRMVSSHNVSTIGVTLNIDLARTINFCKKPSPLPKFALEPRFLLVDLISHTGYRIPSYHPY